MATKPAPKKKRWARHLAEEPGNARAVIAACGAYVNVIRTSANVEEVICRDCRVAYAVEPVKHTLKEAGTK